MTAGVEASWCAPAGRRPTRRGALALLAATTLALLAWAWLAAGWAQQLGDRDQRVVRVAIDASGRATVDGTPAGRRVLERGGTRFLAFDRTVAAERPVRVRVQAPSGLDPGRVATRSVARAGGHGRLVLVTVPASAFPGLAGAATDGELSRVVDPLDERLARERQDLRLQARLREGWWLLLPLGLVAAVAPLLGWRTTRRRFLSMRTPGAGRSFEAGPPSSLDPIGAALLCAGAGAVDHQAAFAGHVLDLVERRQLRMRRAAPGEEPAGGVPPGVRIGLAGAADEVLPEDPAVAVLRTVAEADGVTVLVPDHADMVRRVPPPARAAWQAHVDARARFERILDRWPWRRVACAAGACAAVAVLAAAAGLWLDLPGRRALAWLVAATTAPAALALAGWALDARRWRIVSRSRRLERAQWIAWRDTMAAAGAPERDPRTVPLLAATADDDAMAPALASDGAVALEAVTLDTVRSLRALVAP